MSAESCHKVGIGLATKDWQHRSVALTAPLTIGTIVTLVIKSLIGGWVWFRPLFCGMLPGFKKSTLSGIYRVLFERQDLCSNFLQ